MVEHCCSLHSVELIYIDNDLQTPSDQEELVSEVLDVIQVYGCRVSSKIAGQRSKRSLSEQCINRLSQLWSERKSSVYITRQLRLEGFKWTKQDGTEGELTYPLIYRFINKNGNRKVLEKLTDNNKVVSLDEEIKLFCKTNLIDSVESRLDISVLWDRWIRWTEIKQTHKNISRILFGQYISKLYKRQRVNSCNYIKFCRLKENGDCENKD